MSCWAVLTTKHIPLGPNKPATPILPQDNKMGGLLSIPITGSLGSVATSGLADFVSCFTSSAGEAHPPAHSYLLLIYTPPSQLSVIDIQIAGSFLHLLGKLGRTGGATVFSLIGLVLPVDFAYSCAEICLQIWKNSEPNIWQWILVGSTVGMYALMITLTRLVYGFFAGQSCTLNQFIITFNLILCIIITVLWAHPVVQEANSCFGLVQASVVALYRRYLIMSDMGRATCSQVRRRAHGHGRPRRPVHVRRHGVLDHTRRHAGPCAGREAQVRRERARYG